MRITKEMLSPSNEDAVRLNRNEKMAMLTLAYVATCLEDLQKELKDRIDMVPGGMPLLNEASQNTDILLNELRKTVPIEQRLNLQNTAQEYEVRLTPKATPAKTNVVMQGSEFKELVDLARAKCVDCMESDTACEKCRLYRLLTVLLPLDSYHDGMLCPYNMGEWAN